MFNSCCYTKLTKIEVGKTYKDRDGKEWYIVSNCSKRHPDYPLLGECGDERRSFTLEGVPLYWTDHAELVEEVKPVEYVWFNIYPPRPGNYGYYLVFPHTSRESADKSATISPNVLGGPSSRIACVKVKKTW